MKEHQREIVISLLLISMSLIVYVQVINFDCAFIDDFRCLNVMAEHFTSAPIPKKIMNIEEYHVIGIKEKKLFDSSSLSSMDFLLKNTPSPYWLIPLPILSTLLEAKLFGITKTALSVSHLTNLTMHIACVLALFLVLRFSTGKLWQSAFAAALFAVHPISVTPVSVLSQRTYSFSTFFFLLALYVYFLYSKKPSIKKYILMFCFWVLSFTSHPTTILLPFILFVFDYWPLKKIKIQSGKILISKGVLSSKLPFFIFFILFLATTMALYIPHHINNINGLQILPKPKNILITPIFYSHYLKNIVWPTQLAQTSDLVHGVPLLIKLVTTFSLLITITFLALWQSYRGRAQYLISGWLWFVILLSPALVLHIFSPGVMPRRYGYIPTIGIFIAISWLGGALLSRLKYKKTIGTIMAGTILTALMIISCHQAKCWKNLHNYFQCTLEKRTPNSPLAHRNLGVFLLYENKVQGAIKELRHALSLKPEYADAHYWLGVSLEANNEPKKALIHYRQALRLNPKSLRVLNDMANLLTDMGKINAAIGYYQQALDINPDLYKVHNNLGTALAEEGKTNEAIMHFKKALEISPDYTTAQNNLDALITQTSAPLDK